MIRRQVLLGAVGCLCLSACASLSATARSGASRGESTAGPGGQPGAGETTSAADGAITLEVKPVGETGALAKTTGHCDLDGVLAAQGSGELARGACARDLEVERELAHGLKISGASVRGNEGRVRHLAGDTQQAQLDYQEAIRQDTTGRSPSAVSAFARINLGLLHHEQGDQVTAHEHLRWVLDHSSDPAVRGAAYHNLSLVLLAEGQTEEALDAAQRGHRLLVEALGESHGSVGASLNALGVIHAERDELDEAVEALEAAVQARTAALGDTHPATAASYTNLGVALGRRGDWDDALLAHQEALSIDAVVLGPEHATTAADHGHVGSVRLELGQIEPARESFHEALAILEPVRPVDDPEIERLRSWLMACDEAEAVAVAGHHGRERTPSRSYPDGSSSK